MPKIYTLTRKQLIKTSLAELWTFFSNAANLAEITPGDMNFRVISGDLPDKIFPGQIIRYKVSPLLGIPLTWITEITEVREPYFFVDEQRKGPYKLWHHEHLFEETTEGVWMTDTVSYQLPFGPIGQLAQPLLVKKRLEHIFDYRQKIIEKRFNRKAGT